MDNRNITAAARAHLQNGEIAEAISVLKALLESQPRFAQPLRMLRVVESNYQLARQKEQKGILDFSEARKEYAQATDSILGLLEAVESGRTEQFSPEKKMRRGLWLGIGLAAAVFIGVLVFYPVLRVGCPDFDASKELKVMILPFIAVGPEGKAKPHVLVKNEVDRLFNKVGLSACSAIKTDFDADAELPDKFKAKNVARHCDADLIIWGQYVAVNDTTIRLQLEFASLTDGREGQVAPLALPLSFWEGKMERELGDAVFAVCARVAGLLGNKEVAARWLGKVKTPDATERAALEKLDPASPAPPVTN